ncbi:amino acid ABC transporter permease [Pseudorhodoferax soli]|uniref:Polar amino acid transport system permease protein n=1 Tax=Pseudorhodoferax soli TaxID=545864 RepID=A0A368XE26_9BURK|nr:amino acid ABC transporter permease [Pseudorhodoferax soli]RCW66125.1 polar amino acid transport system permease protein [Pseudorhodoferax soli]
MNWLNTAAGWLPEFVDGFLVTLALVGMCLPAALVLGMLLVLARISSKGLVWMPAYAVIEFLRNVPTFLLILVVYYGAPLLGSRLDGLYCGAIAIAVQHTAYLAEVFRGGVSAVPKTQWDAGRAIGLKPVGIFFRVVLPQAVLKVVPAIGNQVVVLIKDTSLVAGIGVVDLTLTGKLIMERTAASYEVFIVVAIFYLILTTLASGLFRWLEVPAGKRR